MKTMSPKTEQRGGAARQRVKTMPPIAVMILIAAACGSSGGDTSTTTTAAQTTTTSVAATPASPTTTVEEPDTTVGSPPAVVEEFIELRTSGQAVASLDLATADVADDQDFAGGLEVWNLSGELTEPCKETFSGFRCVLSEQNDFHAAGGLGPWTAPLTLTVNEAGLISAINASIVEWRSTISPFNARFMAWFGLAHPEVAAQMSGAPMSDTFNPEDARLALEYVDEFVAQSDDYPIDGTDS